MTIDTTKIDRMDQRTELAAEAARFRAIDTARDALQKPYDDEIAALKQRRDAAVKQFDKDNPVEGDWPSDLRVDGDGYPELCCISGLPLFDDDVLVEDGDCRKALRAAVPGWPAEAAE